MLDILKTKEKPIPKNTDDTEKTRRLETTLIARGITIKACEVTGGGDLRIDGNVIGNINLEGSVIIEGRGNVQGNIHAVNISIYGKVTGDICAKDVIHAYEGGKIIGDIVCPNLVIEHGASFIGKCEMSPSKIETVNANTGNSQPNDPSAANMLAYDVSAKNPKEENKNTEPDRKKSKNNSAKDETEDDLKIRDLFNKK